MPSASLPLRIKRGLEADIPALLEGQLGHCTDTGNLYIGTAGGNELVNGGTAFVAAGAAAGFTVVAADKKKVFNCTGTYTVALTAAATLGSGFYVTIVNASTGTITVDPAGAETIIAAGGAVSTLALAEGESVVLFTNGSVWAAIATNSGAGGGAGESAGFPYLFDTDTTASDPTAGFLRLSSATPVLVTDLYLSYDDADAAALYLYVLTWDDADSTVRGTILIEKESDPTAYLVFHVTGSLTDNTTWASIPVTWAGGAGTLSDNDPVRVQFLRAGNRGTSGQDGRPGRDGDDGEAGPMGPPGERGATGATGAGGAAGATGQTGPPSFLFAEEGERGPMGPPGERGATGAQGSQGPAGNDGGTGATGATGPEGRPGKDGDDGEAGPMGPPGTRETPGRRAIPGTRARRVRPGNRDRLPSSLERSRRRGRWDRPAQPGRPAPEWQS